MQKIGSRIYSVAKSDFPISLRLEARDIAQFAAVVSNVLVMSIDSTLVTSFRSALSQPPGEPLAREFVIPDPDAPATPPQARYQPPASVNALILASFAAANGPRPRYELTIRAANGDVQTTTLSKTTVGANRAPIAFEYRAA